MYVVAVPPPHFDINSKVRQDNHHGQYYLFLKNNATRSCWNVPRIGPANIAIVGSVITLKARKQSIIYIVPIIFQSIPHTITVISDRLICCLLNTYSALSLFKKYIGLAGWFVQRCPVIFQKGPRSINREAVSTQVNGKQPNSIMHNNSSYFRLSHAASKLSMLVIIIMNKRVSLQSSPNLNTNSPGILSQPNQRN